MDKQIKYLLGVLILLLISAYFLSLLSGLPQYFEDDIIAFLETRLKGDISFASISFWPLNKLRLQSFSFVDQNNNQIKIKDLQLNYKLDFRDLKQFIKIDFVAAKKAEIIIRDLKQLKSLSSQLDQAEALDSQPKAAFNLKQLDLPPLLLKTKINIIDSSLVVKTETKALEFNNLNLGLLARAKTDYELNFSSSINLNKFAYQDFEFNNLKTENLKLKFKRQGANSELYFKTKATALAPLLKVLPLAPKYQFENLELDLATLKGDLDLKGKLDLKGAQIENYRAEISSNNLKLKPKLEFKQQSESLDFEFKKLNFIVSGPDFKLEAVQNKLNLANNQMFLDFKLKQNLAYQLKLSAAEFDYNYSFFKPELEAAQLDFDLKLEGQKNNLEKLRAEIKTDKLKTKYAELTKTDFLIKLVDDQLFLEKAKVNLGSEAVVDLKASYDLKNQNYLAAVKAQNLKIASPLVSFLADYKPTAKALAKLEEIKAESLDFNLDLGGYYGSQTKLSATGDLDLKLKFKEQNNDLKLKSDFWYVEQKLFLNSLQLFSDFAYLDLLGEIDFAKKELDLRYAIKNLEPAILNKQLELFDSDLLAAVKPTIKYAEGQIENSFANPSLSTDLHLDQLTYQNYSLSEINLKATYVNDNLQIKDLIADLNQGKLRAEGEVKALTGNPILALNINSENLYFEDLDSELNFDLPLTGAVELQSELRGPIADYQFKLDLKTSNPVFAYQAREFDLSNLSLSLKTENKQLKIEELVFSQQELDFKAQGIYDFQTGFAVDYQLQGIKIQNYLEQSPKQLEKLSGSLNLAGKLKGQLEALKLNFELAGENLFYDNFQLEILANQFNLDLKQAKLELEQFDFNFASGNYSLTGEVKDLTSIPQSELQLELLEVPLTEYFQRYLGLYPLAEELSLTGQTQIKTEGSAYQAKLDLAGHLAQAEKNSFSLKGKVGRELNLSFQASDLPLYFAAESDFNLKTEAKLDFAGEIGGTLTNPILNLSHSLDAIKINQTALNRIEGKILVEGKRRISAAETINFSQGGSLKFDLSYLLAEQNLSLSSDLKDLPLAFILSFFGDDLRADGYLNGKLRADGPLAKPQLNGNFELRGQSLELGIWAPIKNYHGQIEIEGSQALIKNLKGDFVDGQFELGGKLKLLDPAQFWNLKLQASKLYFDHGSLTGNFDSALTFVGPLTEPLLKGKLELYDFQIGVPFKWPKPKAKKDKAVISPLIDLELIPQKNVRVKNQNLDVLIENGDLELDFDRKRDNSLMLVGRLRSSQGRFSYYNSRFSLNNAEVLFTPVDQNDIPNLQVNATTYAGGRQININLNGPANNMRINLSSDTEMTEEEILNLLSSRGALGSAVIGGEDIGVRQIITQELIRIVNGFLQEDIISDLESDFRTALSLDRIEIDALQFGLEREVAIYLGKNLNNRFYLEYAAFFNEEEQRESELSFQYRLTEITNLKGSYFTDDEYQISLETEIEF